MDDGKIICTFDGSKDDIEQVIQRIYLDFLEHELDAVFF